NSFSASADNSLGLFKSLSPSRVLAKFCSPSLDIPMIPSSCFSLSLSIPILDCHHTWCCCGTPSDFYCATQT
ncbi:hypothetical protein STEG23_010712, partial [Scotinomys teguina]